MGEGGEGKRGKGRRGGKGRGREGRGREYRHFFLYTLSTGATLFKDCFEFTLINPAFNGGK